MIVEIDFNSSEALYIQLCHQIILGIATSALREGDTLPSVRQMAETAGINMHTVNKAYALLQDEGFLTIGRRGTVIVVDDDHERALKTLKEDLTIALAKASCRNVTNREVHELIDEILGSYDE